MLTPQPRQIGGPDPDFTSMSNPSLFISRDPDYGWLSALEFGRVSDGQKPSCWRPVDENFAYFVPERARRPRGFHVINLDDFDPWAAEVEGIWTGPGFASPLLGLDAASAGEVIVAAKAYLGDEPTINRAYFDMATRVRGEEAVNLWRCCLESGDPMAHFALGYTLYELGQHREAYAHLRHYIALAPHSSWNWCWLGKAAAAIGARGEAEAAYRRALELTARGDQETDASELLAELSGGDRIAASDDDIPF